MRRGKGRPPPRAPRPAHPTPAPPPCSIKTQATLLELLEESGLPPICATMALEQDAQARLGQLLAEAVKEQRSRKNPRDMWEASGRMVGERQGLDPVEEVVGRQAAQRMVEVRGAPGPGPGGLRRRLPPPGAPRRATAPAAAAARLAGDGACL
jgi:hypothetical protein